MAFTAKSTEFSPPDIEDGDYGEILKMGALSGVPVMFALFTALALWGAHWPLAMAVAALPAFVAGPFMGGFVFLMIRLRAVEATEHEVAIVHSHVPVSRPRRAA